MDEWQANLKPIWARSASAEPARASAMRDRSPEVMAEVLARLQQLTETMDGLAERVASIERALATAPAPAPVPTADATGDLSTVAGSRVRAARQPTRSPRAAREDRPRPRRRDTTTG